MRTIYADNAATTRMSQTAIRAMLPYMDQIYGNPSSLHSVGQAAMEALTDARTRVAAALGAASASTLPVRKLSFIRANSIWRRGFTAAL